MDNKPIVDGLEAYFSGQIDFIHLNTDNFQHRRAGQEVGLFRHTQYLLLDANGNTLLEWNGYLNLKEMINQIESELARSPIYHDLP